MKKSSLHFKIAAWSIKHPNQMYAVTGTALILLLLICAVATSTIIQRQSISTAQNRVSSVAVGKSFEKANWTITGKQMVGERQCVTYRHSTNGTRLTSCYVQDGNEWIFQQSF